MRLHLVNLTALIFPSLCLPVIPGLAKKRIPSSSRIEPCTTPVMIGVNIDRTLYAVKQYFVNVTDTCRALPAKPAPNSAQNRCMRRNVLILGGLMRHPLSRESLDAQPGARSIATHRLLSRPSRRPPARRKRSVAPLNMTAKEPGRGCATPNPYGFTLTLTFAATAVSNARTSSVATKPPCRTMRENCGSLATEHAEPVHASGLRRVDGGLTDDGRCHFRSSRNGHSAGFG